MNNIELVLAVIGSFTLGYITFKGFKWLWVRRTLISFKNPIKQYIRKQVIEYLKELKDE
jgi:hypothetical protein|tara:strand:- start:1210 stop:1386 length:177 start_codon:yes stop_codon:yes gene_type:complete